MTIYERTNGITGTVFVETWSCCESGFRMARHHRRYDIGIVQIFRCQRWCQSCVGYWSRGSECNLANLKIEVRWVYWMNLDD
jgi:hypothetical protein